MEVEKAITPILEKYTNPEREKPIYVFRELHFGKGVGVDPLENVRLLPRYESVNREVFSVFKSNLKTEIIGFVYGWYGIPYETAHKIFNELNSKLSELEERPVLENLFGGSPAPHEN